MSFKMDWKEAFKQDLYKKVRQELPDFSSEAILKFYDNNLNCFDIEWSDDYDKPGIIMYWLKHIDDLKVDDLIHMGKEIFKLNGKPFSIIQWYNRELVFEGYDFPQFETYWERKEKLSKDNNTKGVKYDK